MADHQDSHGLSGLVPGLTLEDSLYPPSLLSTSSLDTVSPGRARSPLDMEPVQVGRIPVQVVPALYHRQTSSRMPAYDMNRRPRGLALLINIESYDNDVQEQRIGSDVDVENLSQLLKGLDFDVAIHRNLHLAAFFKVITEFCCNKMHKEADMAVVVILSHGKDGVVYASDGQSINMEYIYEFFNNRNCPNLMGKPKFFIVQACRGDRPDQGVEEEEGNEAHGQAKKRRAEALDGIAGDIGDVCRARFWSTMLKSPLFYILISHCFRPTWEDMIIAYSTIPGYASLRDHQHGTWFVQSLVEVFMTHSHDTELVDLLRMTSERLSHFTNEQGEKQTCNVEMRLGGVV